MSRTPKREIHKLPLWVQELLSTRENEVNQLVLELEALDDVVKQLEEANRQLANPLGNTVDL